ncbi:retrovirus-related pol polyprotein from transposon TNT 1-94 [Tanacetum coccineum]|uniref:Retrovirus-related pol polyprotein from transposon TNT 1-94 n=1 Tax=Tanacetum coccineum TaxID=301880 RepID=A0ABQ4XSX1_9ASTR
MGISRPSSWAKAGIDYNEVFSLVVRHTSIRVIRALTACKDYELEQLAVKTAFLHGNLEEVIYMRQPQGYEQATGSSVAVTTAAYITGVMHHEFDMKELGEAKKILGMEIVRDRIRKILRVSQSGPDIAYAVSVVSRYLANSGFVYSDYTKDPDKGRSITGYTFLVHGCVLSWKATLQHMVALSTTEVEYMALMKVAKEAIWLKGLLEETKHINVRYHFIKEVLEAKTVKVLKVGTEHNVADALTKVVPGLKLQHCLELLNVGVG